MTMPAPATDLKAEIKEEHHAAELLRLHSGLAGCGCTTCQELYRHLDLTRYGKRVYEFEGVFIVEAGLAGTDPVLVERYHRQDNAGQVSPRPQDKREVRTKLPDGENTPEEKAQSCPDGVLSALETPKKAGRPRLPAGQGCARTLRRQHQAAEQGVLFT